MMKIGELAVKSQVSIKTIRYYEEIGLLQVSDRTEGRFRLFSAETVSRLLFIKRLQILGLSLQEIKDCLVVFDRGELPCAELRIKLEHPRQTRPRPRQRPPPQRSRTPQRPRLLHPHWPPLRTHRRNSPQPTWTL
jgi:DNA-binding transcriptional MerR regulator